MTNLSSAEVNEIFENLDDVRRSSLRGAILGEAYKIINQREDEYGNPENSFEIIGKLWAIALDLDEPISPYMTALMLALFKIGRQLKNHKHDNLVDCLGYIALSIECDKK